MTSALFHGGPARGFTPTGLKRTPTFVRVVQAPSGAFDVLNDLDDTPRDDELVVAVYVLDPESHIYACSRGNGSAGGAYVTYVHLPMANVALLRTEELWIYRLAEVVGLPPTIVQEQRAGERRGLPPVRSWEALFR